MSQAFVLITGRTSEQGQSLHQGKTSPAYRNATTWVEMSHEDMAHHGIEEGQVVRVRTMAGQVEVVVRLGDLPPGLLFMPIGPCASLLAGANTDGTGMPALKGIAAWLELA